MSNDPNQISFTARQLAWLEQQYPQMSYGPETDEKVLRHYFGQQSVLTAVRKRTQRNSNGPL